jgi:Bacteriophage holin family
MKIIAIIAATLLTFIAPIQGLILLMICFIGADTLLGIYTAIKLGGIQAFKSTKLFNIVVKSFFYTITIIMAFGIDKYVFDSTIFNIQYLLAKVMTMLWIYIETKSIDETSMKLGNKSFWVILKDFTSKLKSLKKDLGELTESQTDSKEEEE